MMGQKRLANPDRFSFLGNCKCDHIDAGKCKQCSACDVCEHYTHIDQSIQLRSGNYIWGGELRGKRTAIF